MAIIELPFDTLAYSPRAIALTYTDGDSKFYLCPFRDITGGALVRSPHILEKRLRETQEYKVRQKRLYEEGKSYNRGSMKERAPFASFVVEPTEKDGDVRYDRISAQQSRASRRAREPVEYFA